MVRIRDAHTNIVRIEVNDQVVLEKEEITESNAQEEPPLIHTTIR